MWLGHLLWFIEASYVTLWGTIPRLLNPVALKIKRILHGRITLSRSAEHRKVIPWSPGASGKKFRLSVMPGHPGKSSCLPGSLPAKHKESQPAIRPVPLAEHSIKQLLFWVHSTPGIGPLHVFPTRIKRIDRYHPLFQCYHLVRHSTR